LDNDADSQEDKPPALAERRGYDSDSDNDDDGDSDDASYHDAQADLEQEMGS